MEILNYAAPGIELRDTQIEILEQVQTHWDRADIIVLKAPVGSGKSHIANTIANWAHSTKQKKTAILTHRVSLQDQYERSFPDTPALAGVGRYQCPKLQMSCADAKEALGGYCESTCVYSLQKAKVAASPIAVFNYHVYIYSYEKRDVLIGDEAHSIFDILSEIYSLTLWKHKEKYPDGLRTCGDIAVWLEGQIKGLNLEIATLKAETQTKETQKQVIALTKTVNKYQKVLSGLQRAPLNFFIEAGKGDYRGQQKEMLRVRPTTMEGLPAILWNGKVNQKIVLMSGTIGEEDIKKLGFTGRRIKYITGRNPIPADRRPVDVSWGRNMSYEFQDRNVPAVCEKIKEIAARYPGKKGLVHLTYGLAEKFKAHLTGPQYLWHTSENREEVLAKYLESTEPVILMACGFSEGIDLAGEQFYWQAIAKISWPSKEDALIAKYYRDDPLWVRWGVVKAIEQQAGRISRSPTDYGKTFILDSSFGNPTKKRRGLIDQCRHLFSKSFLEAIEWE